MATAADTASQLQCSMCENLTEDLVTLSCGHTFCRSCLDQLVKMSDPQCPNCPQAPRRVEMDDPSHFNTDERASGLTANTEKLQSQKLKSAKVTKAAEIVSQLQCSMCKNLKEDSVTESCGHTFFNSCLYQQVDNRGDRECPLCHEAILQAQMDDLSLLYTGNKGEIPCNLCPFIAVKSCLTCLLSYCECHLKPHQTMERLRGHKLVKPVKRLEERACSVHGRPLELYSTQDERCICALCVTPGVDVIPVETERKRREAKQKMTIVELESVIEKGGEKIIDLKNTVRNTVAEISKEQKEISKVFAAVMDAVKTAENELIAPLEDERKRLEREMEDKAQQI